MRNVAWHVTVESNGSNHQDNPRYYSKTSKWANLTGSTLNGDDAVNEATEVIGRLGEE